MTDDDFPFAEEEQDKEKSFVEVFDFRLFDKESLFFLQQSKPAPPAREKRLPSPEEQLDLHGFTASEAEIRAESFLVTARGKGLEAVRIITGKGLHSEGKAVLPDVVEQVVRAMKTSGPVEDYVWEKGEKSKSGAVIVYLKVAR